MATDSTLVKGAYDANKGYNIDKTGVSKAINKGVKDLSKAAKKRVKEEEAKEKADKLSSIEAADKARKNTEAVEDTSEQQHRQYKRKVAKESHEDRLATAIEMYGQEDSILDSDREDEVIALETKKGWEAAEDNPGIDSHFDNMKEILEQQKKDIEPSKLKETGVKVLNTLSSGVQKFKGLKERMLELNRNRRKGTGFTKGIDAKTNANLAGIASGNVPLETNTINGEVQIGFRIDDEYLTMGDVDRLLDDNQVDVESQAGIVGIRDAQISLAENARPESVFNTEKVRSSIVDIVSKGNLKSLVHDETFGGTSFAEDILKSDFAGMTYSSLGISDIYDTDGDGKLTSNDNLSMEDKKAIVEELINNPNNVSLLEEEVTNYFTAHIQKNWDMNHKNRPQSNPLPDGSMMNTYKPEQQTNASSLKVDLPGVPKRSLSPEEKLKAQLEKKQESGYSSMDYINMIKF